MLYRGLLRFGLIMGAVLLFLPPCAFAQNAANRATAALSSPPGKAWVAPRTSWGHPDLQGIWSTATITPLERPAELAGKEFFTEQEALEYERQVVERTNRDRRDGGATADVARAYNDFWWDTGTRVVPSRRTVAHHRSARRARAAAHSRRGKAIERHCGGAQAARSRRSSRGSQSLGALHHAWPSQRDAPAALQQQLSSASDPLITSSSSRR